MGRKKPARARRHNDFRHGKHTGPVQGSGTQHITYNSMSSPGVPPALASLPPVPPEFTGREDELDELLDLLDPRRQRPDGGLAAVPTAAVVAGLPGVGKTTLAVTAGHRALERGWFTGVQFVNLRGYDQAPVQPGQALDALLRSLGVPVEHIPGSVDERQGLYRSQLEIRAQRGERLLIVADNASESGQVTALLPGTPRHRLLITSRHTLTGMGARLVDLTTLPLAASVELLRRALYVAAPDDHRVEDDPESAEALARACGFLPLALQITAALLTADRGQPLAERARQLGQTGGRLAELDDGSRAVRAPFEQSLMLLTPQQVDMFRLLSLNPGPTISTKSAAILADRSETEARDLLNGLARGHLLERSALRDCWQMHDLLRDYAAELATAHAERGRRVRRRHARARTRLMSHHVRTTRSAALRLEALPGHEVAGVFGSRDEALAWLDMERSTLVAAVHLGRLENDPQAAALATHLGIYLKWRRLFDDLYAVTVIARDTYQDTGDKANEAVALGNLSHAFHELRRYEEARAAAEKARDIFQDTGNQMEEAHAWINYSAALEELHRLDEALEAVETARRIFQKLGDQYKEAMTWVNVADVYFRLRRFNDALNAAETARDIYQRTGDRHKEATAWNNLSSPLLELRRFDQAAMAAEQARDIFRETDDRTGEAMAWNNFSNAARRLRRFDEATAAAEKSRDIFQETGDRHREAMAWINLSNGLAESRRFEEALAAAETSRALYRETADRRSEGMAWAGVSSALLRLYRNDEATEAARTARDIARETGDRHKEGQATLTYSCCLGELRRFEEALTASRTALDIFRETGDRHREGMVWNNTGAVLNDLRRPEEALTAAETARDIARELGVPHEEGSAWTTYGRVLHQLKRFDESLAAADRSLALCEGIGHRHGVAVASTNRSEVLRELGRFDESLAAAEAAGDYFREVADRPREALALRRRGAALRAAGRLAEAIEAGERTVRLAEEVGRWEAGRAYEELAKALAAAGTAPARVSDAWRKAAAAFTDAGGGTEAEEARTKAADGDGAPARAAGAGGDETAGSGSGGTERDTAGA
ncbi:tetratricopeptide repeat protein [Streptomyces sp. NPDC055078]